MTWATIKRWWTSVEGGSAKQNPAVTPETPSAAECEDRMTRGIHPWNEGDRRNEPPHTSQRRRAWRQRALLRKGARLYSTVTWSRDFVSLAMLDEDGVIVAWYEPIADRDASERVLVKGHVSQLYTQEDVALGVPIRDLCTATIHGQCVQTGWRRRGDSPKFWATTTIEPEFLRDGRLQGFSHVTHRSPAPWTEAGEKQRWPWNRSAGDSSRRESTNGGRTEVLTRNQAASSNVRRISRAVVAAATLLVTSSIPIPAAAARVDSIPTNATRSDYGSGWDCLHGFRRVADGCTKIAVPANAYIDASGNRWRCERGYLAVDTGCALIKVPANAYLDESYGTGWRCERRYREIKGACVAIRIPVNAHAVDSSYGTGWECNYGYALGSDCQAVIVPANAYLTSSGETWRCDRGFIETAHGCARIELPQHAFIDTQGNDWTCGRGFRKTESRCQAVEVPANAHLDYSGNRWRCNRGFRDRSDSCIEK